MTTQRSVLQDWVMELPLRQQGVLVLALRGPDGVLKESKAKPLLRVLRGLVMVSGRMGTPMSLEGVGELWRDDTFMNTRLIVVEEFWNEVVKWFLGEWDSYNVHFLQHLIHAYAIIGINHPNDAVRERCWAFYVKCCEKLHMKHEAPDEIVYRLRSGKREEEDE